MLEEPLDYRPQIVASRYCATNIKGLVIFGPVLTIQERAHRDDLTTALMYSLEMHCHWTGGYPSTNAEL